MLCSKSSPSAPMNSATGRSRKNPSTASTTPHSADTVIISVNISFALSCFRSPMVLAIGAPPPVPNMKPTQPSTSSSGIIRLTAANAVLPA